MGDGEERRVALGLWRTAWMGLWNKDMYLRGVSCAVIAVQWAVDQDDGVSFFELLLTWPIFRLPQKFVTRVRHNVEHSMCRYLPLTSFGFQTASLQVP